MPVLKSQTCFTVLGDGTAVVLPARGSDVFHLNDTAATFVHTLIEHEGDRDASARVLAARFDTDGATITADLESLCAELAEWDLLAGEQP